MKINEVIIREFVSLRKEEREKIIKDFIEFSKKRLHIKTKFHVNFGYDADEAQDEHHSGSFNQGSGEIWVYMHKRNLVDILRTIAHELTHVKQAQENRLPAQTTPESKEEAEAFAVAGYLIKIYSKGHPHIYE